MILIYLFNQPLDLRYSIEGKVQIILIDISKGRQNEICTAFLTILMKFTHHYLSTGSFYSPSSYE